MRKAGHFLMCLRATHISTSGDLFASFSLLTYFYSLPLSSAWLMVMILINAASFLPLRSIFSPNIMAFGFCVIFRPPTVVQLLSGVQFFATTWTAACQAPLSSTISQSLLKFMSIE